MSERLLAFDLTAPEMERMYMLGQFMRKVEFHRNGHWLWRASMTDDGYGRWQKTGTRKKVLAHRFTYEQFIGPIPEGMEIDHLCGIRNCCCPNHLEPVLPRINVQRGHERRAIYARATPVL